MLALGIVLVLLAAGATAAALLGGSDEQATFDLGAVDIETNTVGVFLAGAVTVLLLVAGLAMIRTGTKRATQHRRERRELTRLSEELDNRSAEADRGTDKPRHSTEEPPAGPPAGHEEPPAGPPARHEEPLAGPPTRQDERPGL